MVFVIVNQYIKYAKYISAHKNWDIELFANMIVKKVFIKFEIPRLITNNQDFFFKSIFWSDFYYYIKVWLRYSTAFYLQTDRHTKHQNQILKQYVRNYINH